MRHLIRLSDYTKDEIFEIFKIADELQTGKYNNYFNNKIVVMFFPATSIRTRVTFEKGIYLLGGQSILFAPETLDKKENIKDVVGYINNWTDAAVIRHNNIIVLDIISKFAEFPIINAMTNDNHPCEILSDIYALSKMRKNFINDSYLFCGAKGNIGSAWKEAADVLNLQLAQCCPKGYELDGVTYYDNLVTAIKGRDIICTDSYPNTKINEFIDYQINEEIMDMANTGAVLNPCPPFYRGEEVSDNVINSSFFVGYKFKKHLIEIQQAVIIFNMTH